MITKEKRQKIVKSHPRLSLDEQCNLLTIHISGVYYKPQVKSALNLQLMKIIDKYFMELPYFRIERMTYYSWIDKGFNVNKKIMSFNGDSNNLSQAKNKNPSKRQKNQPLYFTKHENRTTKSNLENRHLTHPNA